MMHKFITIALRKWRMTNHYVFALWVSSVLFNSCDGLPSKGNKPNWSLDSLKSPFHGESNDGYTNTAERESEDETELENSQEQVTAIQHLLNCSVSIEVYDYRDIKLGSGSGVFIDENVIATSYHVIEDGSYFIISRNSDAARTKTNTVISTDAVHDVALLRAKLPNSHKMDVENEYPAIGERIIVAGSPHELSGTVTDGIVSQIRDFGNDFDMIQISAPISPGSSGGPVMNTAGNLIGLSKGGIQKEAQNLNFMVPIKYVTGLMK
jgi:S1-C subfamily serine protease